LHIYDADDFMIDLTASVRRAESWNIHPVPVHGGKIGLRTALDELVKDGWQFQRALFETHGSSGSIAFGGQSITGNTFRTYYAGRGYERIFSYWFCRIYFNGCNVADDPGGWDFLDAAGAIFLRIGGGTVFGQTGSGRPIIFTGHIHHFRSSTSYSVWWPGGKFLGHDVE
jgi:hypothetical protein